MATMPTSALIFNRTKEDIKNRTEKAFMNLADVQRVQDWVNYFIDEVNLPLPKYTWSQYERVDLSKWATYVLGNTNELLKMYPSLNRISKVPTADKWDFEKQNELEYIFYNMIHYAHAQNPVSFATDSLETIVMSVLRGTYKTVYHVGDTKQIQMNDGSTVELKIVGIDGALDSTTIPTENKKYHLLLRSGLSEEEYQYHHTASGFYYSPSYGYGSSPSKDTTLCWENCDLRNIVMPQIKKNLPSLLKNYMKKVQIQSLIGYTYTAKTYSYYASDDDVFIEGTGNSIYSPASGSSSLPKFSNEESGITKWTRSMYVSDKDPATAIMVNGNNYSWHNVTEKHKIRWCFCL